MIVLFEAIILIAEPELTQAQFNSLLPMVTAQKQEKLKRFRSYKDAQNCLLGDVLTRREICRLTGFCNEELDFSVNEYGKPFLLNTPSMHFNVSHTGHFVALTIDNVPVGIDIELIKPFKDRVADRFFAPDELEYVLSVKDQERLERFFEVWTKKESRIKMDGKGLFMPLTSFSVLEESKHEQITYHKVFHNEQAICHVCTTKKEPPLIRVINTEDIWSSHEHQ